MKKIVLSLLVIVVLLMGGCNFFESSEDESPVGSDSDKSSSGPGYSPSPTVNPVPTSSPTSEPPPTDEPEPTQPPEEPPAVENPIETPEDGPGLPPICGSTGFVGGFFILGSILTFRTRRAMLSQKSRKTDDN